MELYPTLSADLICWHDPKKIGSARLLFTKWFATLRAYLTCWLDKKVRLAAYGVIPDSKCWFNLPRWQTKIGSAPLLFTNFLTLRAYFKFNLPTWQKRVGLALSLFTKLCPTLSADLTCQLDKKKEWIGTLIIYRVVPDSETCRFDKKKLDPPPHYLWSCATL